MNKLIAFVLALALALTLVKVCFQFRPQIAVSRKYSFFC